MSAFADVCFEIAHDVVLRDEDRLCFKRSSGAVFYLNDIGYASLLSFGSQCDMRTVAATIGQLWKAHPDRVEADLEPLALELLSHGIIRRLE